MKEKKKGVLFWSNKKQSQIQGTYIHTASPILPCLSFPLIQAAKPAALPRRSMDESCSSSEEEDTVSREEAEAPAATGEEEAEVEVEEH